MRSTMKISGNTMLNNILGDYARVYGVQNQMATGQRVNKPSDDALATNQGLRFDTMISRVTQYNRNNQTGLSFLGLSDGTLSNLHKLQNTTKSLTTSSASETTTHEMRQANAIEVQSSLSEIVTLANAAEAGRYLFGGTETTEPPYQVIGSRYVYYSGNEQDITIQTDSASVMAINTTGEKVFGSMTSSISTRDLSPQLSMSGDYSTRLQDLNNGLGVPKGSINIKYSAYPENGINIDLSGCDTVRDVARQIEAVTKTESAKLDPDGTAGSPISYLSKRYVKVELTEDGSGIQLVETDPVWETTWNQQDKQPTDYPGFQNPSKMIVSEVGGSIVATRLGVRGTVNYTKDPLNAQRVIPQPLVGSDVDPAMTKNTLLADMKDYCDKPFTIINGPLPDKVGILEVNDTQNSYGNWNLTGLDEGANTDKSGNLYLRTEEKVAGSGEYYLRMYKSEACLARDLVAESDGPINSGTPVAGGVVTFAERNNSGISGTVEMPAVTLPVNQVAIKAQFDESFSATISVSAYQQELTDESFHDVMTEFRMRGMRKGGDPQSKAYDPCDINGNFKTEVVNDWQYRASAASGGAVNIGDVSLNTSDLVLGTDFDANRKIYCSVDGAGNLELYNDSARTVQIGAGAWNVDHYDITAVGAGNVAGTLNTADGQQMTGPETFDLTMEPAVTVNVYNAQSSPRSLIATGSLGAGLMEGTVELTGQGNFDYLTGSVYVDWSKNIDPATDLEYTDVYSEAQDSIGYNMKSTFATVEDLMNAVNNSNTYTTARISTDGNGVDIVSHLAGAHMIVTESVLRANHYNDEGQLGDVNFNSIIKDFNTSYDGKIYTNIQTEKTQTVDVGGGLMCDVYRTAVNFYNLDPQDADFDLDANLVGSASTEAAYDSATGDWYVKNSLTNTWDLTAGYPAQEPLVISQSNHSGIAGTVELNSVRLPQPPYTVTNYFDPTATAGQQSLNNAIVIDTVSDVFNRSVSASGQEYDYLTRVAIANAQQGINTDEDGNLHVTTGFAISGDDNSLVCQLDLNGVVDSNGAAPVPGISNTDSTGKLYTVTSYGIDGDDTAGAGGRQIHQLNLTRFTRGTDSSRDGKIYVEIDATGSAIRCYNDSAHTNLVATAALPVGGGIASFTAAAGYNLSGSLVVPDPATMTDDNDVVIDLERGTMMIYNDSALGTGDLVASGTCNTAGQLTFAPENGSGITGSARFPTPNGQPYVQFDRSITVDTRQREALVYSDEDYSRQVARGSYTQGAGGEVTLSALNGSALGGSLYFDATVEDTDTARQIKNLSLDTADIRLGVNTTIDGQVFLAVRNDATNGWMVEMFSSNDPAGPMIASGVIDMNSGNVTLTPVGANGIGGSLKVANPPSWYPTTQNVAGGLIEVDLNAQNPEMVVSPARGLQNSGENREENIFTTLNDVMDAMVNDDVEALHDLLAKFDIDNDRILSARANIGTRIDRLELLTARHEDEVISFKKTRSEYIDLDYSQAVVDYQTAQNTFDAALRVTAQLLPMSLVDFI